MGRRECPVESLGLKRSKNLRVGNEDRYGRFNIF